MTADPMTALQDQLGVLGVALAQWDGRDDTKPQAKVRQAANTAMHAIDGLLRDLHQLRSPGNRDPRQR